MVIIFLARVAPCATNDTAISEGAGSTGRKTDRGRGEKEEERSSRVNQSCPLFCIPRVERERDFPSGSPNPFIISIRTLPYYRLGAN